MPQQLVAVPEVILATVDPVPITATKNKVDHPAIDTIDTKAEAVNIAILLLVEKKRAWLLETEMPVVNVLEAAAEVPEAEVADNLEQRAASVWTISRRPFRP